VLMTPGTSQFFVDEEVTDTGAAAFILTSEMLDPGDGDGLIDWYRMDGGTPRLFSPNTLDGTGLLLHDVSDDGEVAAIGTADNAVGSDTDNVADLYFSHNGQMQVAERDGDAAQFGGMSTAGEGLFSTDEALVSSDIDGGADAYVWRRGTGFELITTGPGVSVGMQISPDGRRVLTFGPGSFVPEDSDGARSDAYLFSTDPPAEPQPPCAVGADPSLAIRAKGKVKRGKAKVRVSNNTACALDGKVKLKGARKTRGLDLAAGAKDTAKLKLTAGKIEKLEDAGKLSARATYSFTDPSGATGVERKKLKLRG
jgi:hypothetical protein